MNSQSEFSSNWFGILRDDIGHYRDDSRHVSPGEISRLPKCIKGTL